VAEISDPHDFGSGKLIGRDHALAQFAVEHCHGPVDR
jgi:hypothetical protein